ncbi:D-glycero-beta-D-manno-heptose 1,7-bisphosphate 7-phosphatase [Candidatus Woesearchaeota archaeon]|nr:D-glycero-beta-D-manno-heptose 1,7-bisphosphate 7-phosphatase [Candidatus Woesearchaeota archaeon]
MNKAVFLDRDGTINVDTGYLHKKKDFELIPGVIEALAELSKTDFKIIIITSQSGIGRGYFTEEDYYNLTEYMLSLMREKGIKIDGMYFCPHHPEKAVGKYKIVCDCRKPKIGMIECAAAEHDIDLSQSYVIGDKTADIEMGRRAGCKSILVKTGKAGEDDEFDIAPYYVGKTLKEAIEKILIENG